MVQPNDVESVVRRSLEASLARLRRDHVDVFLLHGAIVPDGSTPPGEKRMRSVDVTVSFFREHVRPAFMRIVEQRTARAWGITAAGPLQAMLAVLADEPAPDAAQFVANLLDSPGDMHIEQATPKPRAIISAAASRGVGVMGIRAVQAGALTDALDHPADEAARRRSITAAPWQLNGASALATLPIATRSRCPASTQSSSV
jgi:aryl-alcohol dehydrogenase-like predicted oxidoreductase